MKEDQVVVKVQVTSEEWGLAEKLAPITAPWENGAIGHLRLTGDGERRCWLATDNARVVRVVGDAEAATFELSIPPRLTVLAQQVCRDLPATELCLLELDDGARILRVRGDVGEVMVPASVGRYPDADAYLDELAVRGFDLEVDRRLLVGALRAVGIRPEPLGEGETPPPLTFGVDDDGAWLKVPWPRRGPTLISVPGATSQPCAPKLLDLRLLGELVEVFEDGDEVLRVSFGQYPEAPVLVAAGRTQVALMPLRSDADRRVEEVIERVFGPDALILDGDGDYQLKTAGVPVWARLLGGDPPALRVFATVAADVECSPELLRELNDYNSSLRFLRVEWSNDIVTAAADLVADSLDPDELFTAFSRVDHVAENIGPMIVSVFGGRDLNNDAERWAAYLHTDIVAAVMPEAFTYLNGADAVEPWPFSRPVHVITAHNPYNLVRSASENAEANRRLAVELARLDARFCSCAGEARDVDYVEQGFLVWNLELDTIRRVAEQFRQEAVFELTDEELRLVHVASGSATAAPRRS